MGDSLTIADFPMLDAIHWNITLDPEMVNKYQNVMEYFARLKNEPKIKSFLDSDKAFNNFFAPPAFWDGGRK